MDLSPEVHSMAVTNPRWHIVQRLRQELLGPRGGRDERLDATQTDPREEYTTGVLGAPGLGQSPEAELEQLESSVVVDVGCDDDDEEPSDPLYLAADFAPSVDPRLLPCSIGISFLLRSSPEGTFEVCVTAGRYARVEDEWRRHSCLWRPDPFPAEAPHADLEHPDYGLRLALRYRRLSDDCLRVSVYLLNSGSWSGQSAERPSGFLYQPQLRICLADTVELLGLRDSTTDSPEDSRLQFLYRNNPIKARGHLCAAVWRDIDPEQMAGSPMQWLDGLPEHRGFARPDLRTEMMPMLAVSTPLVDWRQEYGVEPERHALALAESYQPEALQAALGPLMEGYASWLKERDAEANGLDPRYQRLASEHLDLCRESLQRMRSGLELLLQDPEARLAFCLANRAVHEQACWAGHAAMAWRPFQLGFMLQCLKGLTHSDSPERAICDLLWFPTGGGKTEAYLGLTAYVLGLRRLRHDGYDGTAVISRYTLRLLSIQQFRRALKLVTACEMLRVSQVDGRRGWRPSQSELTKDWLWGRHRFSAGLWLGGAVTPNRLASLSYPVKLAGAFELLQGKKGDSEPAQVTECPVCDTVMAVPDVVEGAETTILILYLRVENCDTEPEAAALTTAYVEVQEVEVFRPTPRLATLRFVLRGQESTLRAEILETWWDLAEPQFGQQCRLLAARASRPGYFLRHLATSRGSSKPWNVELFCPNPGCPTAAVEWSEQLPVSLTGEHDHWQPVHPAVESVTGWQVAFQCPIPALTVDDQLYAWPPSVLVSTVDKFARLAFEPRAATLFGNVECYHAQEGFYRLSCTRLGKKGDAHPPFPGQSREVTALPPPELIIQDELHLIDGPLGSMVGLYETVIQALCGPAHRPKYVASTATVREARDQVQALFCRELRQFPPPSLDANDSFFALLPAGDVFAAKGSGRLYLGYCPPGRGALTPLVRAWSVLLCAGQELKDLDVGDQVLDPYWSPVGYFSAIRQLASVSGLWRQAIPQRLTYLSGESARSISSPLELSSRIASYRLPGILTRLAQTYPAAVDGVLTTSMFGTGVDVSRLSLMLMHGQPKTTSAYIQATGRVGRQSPGLVLTVLPATNPRALDHFEFFTGYHHQLYRGVEPVTVFPYAPRARERGLGPLCVALLRQLRGVNPGWRDDTVGARMIADPGECTEVDGLARMFEVRAQQQPEMRRPKAGSLVDEVARALAGWRALAEQRGSELTYAEYTLLAPPSRPVVLGDPQHTVAGFPSAFANTPQSLREVEATTGFQV